MRCTETRDHWTLTNDANDIVAQVGPAYLRQPKHVLLYPLCTAGERTEALSLAARRCVRYSWENSLDDATLLKERGVAGSTRLVRPRAGQTAEVLGLAFVRCQAWPARGDYRVH